MSEFLGFLRYSHYVEILMFYLYRDIIMANNIDIHQCGIKFDPPAIVITYTECDTKKHRRRTMPLRDFTKTSNVEKAAEELRKSPRHKKYVSHITLAQLERLITIIKDKLNGLSLTESVERNNKMDAIDPEEDLNRVDEETLKRKKAVMENTFEKHQVKPTDPDFKYDVEVEFETNHVIESGWDSDEGSDQEF